jgi:hypothetical protein
MHLFAYLNLSIYVYVFKKMEFKVVISDSESGKSYQRDIKDEA